MLKKCDILIPVYNAPEWVKLCVYSLMINTPKEYINKVYLLDDCSDDFTKNLMNNISKKYPNYVSVISNKNNLGFVKNCNKGLKLSMEDSNSECVLLLNSDCLVSKNTIGKLMQHINENNKIGLICPISSNAANLTLDYFDGYDFIQMDQLLEKNFKGKNFDACTVVGNCLMITKECIAKTGYLDEIFGMGYGEETDYHFRALKNGFQAKVAIDTYVFHKAEASFGNSIEKQEKLDNNRKIFFDRWGEEYNKCIMEYEKNDPIEYIKSYFKNKDIKPTINTLIYLPNIVQNAGGCHVVIDLINYMIINGYSANILYNGIYNYKEIMLFKAIQMENINDVYFKQIVSTIWNSIFNAYDIANRYNLPLTNFVQGYEEYFENGGIYGIVELSYKLADNNLTISKYLQNKLKSVFNYSSDVISNSIHLDFIKKENFRKKIRNFTIILRESIMKGDFLLLDIVKILDNKFKNIKINIIYMNNYIEFPNRNLENKNEINYIKGPLERKKIYNILQETDIYIDASINEGFGLTALEAMAGGAVPVVSNSFGVLEYMENGKNGFVINEVNDVNKYIDKIDALMNNNELFLEMRKNGKKTIEKYDYDNRINDYIEYFKKSEKLKHTKKILNKKEKTIVFVRTDKNGDNNINIPNEVNYTPNISKKKKFIRKISRIIPKFIKNYIKKVITFLYNCYKH